MKKYSVLVILATLSSSAPAPAQAESHDERCILDTENSDWLKGVLGAWDEVRTGTLELQHREPIWIFLLGETCAWEIAERGAGIWDGPQQPFGEFSGEALFIRNNLHGGKIAMPDGGSREPSPIATASFSFQLQLPYLILADLDIWRQVAGDQLGERLPDFFKGVAFHELTHTQHIRLVAAEVKQLQATYKIEDAVGDAMFEEKYGKEPDFISAYNEERAAWADAIRQKAVAAKKAAARRALNAYRQRQKEFYGDRLAPYTRLEDIFLTMEGAAIWAALQMGLDPSQLTDPIDVANHYETDRGEFVQDEGILMTTLAEQVTPDWKKGAFEPVGDKMVTLSENLEKWAGGASEEGQ